MKRSTPYPHQLNMSWRRGWRKWTSSQWKFRKVRINDKTHRYLVSDRQTGYAWFGHWGMLWASWEISFTMCRNISFFGNGWWSGIPVTGETTVSLKWRFQSVNPILSWSLLSMRFHFQWLFWDGYFHHLLDCGTWAYQYSSSISALLSYCLDCN